MLNAARVSFREVYEAGAEKGDVYAVVEYDWHHRDDGGVHEGADDCSGEDDIRNGVVNSEEG